MMKEKQFKIKKLKKDYFVEWQESQDRGHLIKVSLHAMHCLRGLLKEAGYRETS